MQTVMVSRGTALKPKKLQRTKLKWDNTWKISYLNTEKKQVKTFTFYPACEKKCRIFVKPDFFILLHKWLQLSITDSEF